MITIDSDHTERKITLQVSYQFYDDWTGQDITMQERVSVVVFDETMAIAEHYGYELPDSVMDEIDEALGMRCEHVVVFEDPEYNPYLPENLQLKERYARRTVRAGD